MVPPSLVTAILTERGPLVPARLAEPPVCSMTPADSRALMAREIAAQPQVLAQAIEPLVAAAASLAPPSGGIFWIFGCGDGLYAGETMARVGRRVRPSRAPGLGGQHVMGQSPRVRRRLCRSVDLRRHRPHGRGGGARPCRWRPRRRGDGQCGQCPRPRGGCDARFALSTDLTGNAAQPRPYHDASRARRAVRPAGNALRAAVAAVAAANAPMREAAERIAARPVADARFFFLGCGSALGSADMLRQSCTRPAACRHSPLKARMWRTAPTS